MWIQLTIAFLVIGLGLLFLRLSFTITTVDGWSMFPTLEEGDRLLTFNLFPQWWLKREQIVVGKIDSLLTEPIPDLVLAENIDELPGAPLDIDFSNEVEMEATYLEPDCSKFIKRITGLPGDTISIPLSSLHADMQSMLKSQANADGNLVWQIAKGYCFVRGDNPVCVDSLTVGPIPIADLTGITVLKLPRRSPIETEPMEFSHLSE
jgi:signal peptidase I